ALKLINTLIQEGFNVIAYDPIVKSEINGITKAQNKDECINSSDIIIVATEWPEFKGIEEKTSKPIIDARRLLDASKPNVFPIGLGRLNR
ncbi:MAG: UDP-glucose/GDP-mannose dehydrogenase family protein, partial [Caldisphaera sp.]